MRKLRILIVHPDPSGLSLLTSMLKSLGHLIEEAANDRVAVRQLERNEISLVLASVDPADSDALELLNYVRRKHPQVPVIILFPGMNHERAKEAHRLGAMAVLKYPVPASELRAAVLQGLELYEPRPGTATPSPTATMPMPGLPPVRPSISPMLLDSHLTGGTSSGQLPPNRGVGALAGQPTLLDLAPIPSYPGASAVTSRRGEELAREVGLIGTDPTLKQIIDLAGALAATRSTVLIMGEPGVGKSLLARLIHLGAGRADRPLVTLSPDEIEDDPTPTDDLAGPASKGTAIWSSKLVMARGGTLHIKEVASLSLDLQLQLVRQLQLQDIEAATGQSSSDVRIVLSTSENLPALVEQGRFRQELYHRINGICLMVPPLRRRGADIELLAEHFRGSFALEFRKNVLGFSRDALEVMQRHDWPGNVRELQGFVQRAVALCTGPRITSTQVAPILSPHRTSRGLMNQPRPHVPIGLRPLKEALEEPEKRIIIQALQALNWNRQETARVLDINRTTLYKKMKKYGLLVDEPMWAS